VYTVTGRNTALTAVANKALWVLFNPHSTQIIKLVQWSMFSQSGNPASNWSCRLQRVSARGSPNNTVTPNISNHSTLGAAPPSGALFDQGHHNLGEPTLLASSLDMDTRVVFGTFQSAGYVQEIPGGIDIPPGTGIAMIQVGATVSVAFDNTVSWLEDWI
jgi:hypothetical protein